MVGGVCLADCCYVGYLPDGPVPGHVVGVAEAKDDAQGADWVGCC